MGKRKRRLQTVGVQYEHLPVAQHVCFYCGEPSDTLDHVPPVSIAAQHADLRLCTPRTRYVLVPSCADCNTALGNSMQSSLAERCAELKVRLEKRNRKLLDMPRWSMCELRQVEATLRQSITNAQYHKALLEKRLAHVPDALDLEIEPPIPDVLSPEDLEIIKALE